MWETCHLWGSCEAFQACTCCREPPVGWAVPASLPAFTLIPQAGWVGQTLGQVGSGDGAESSPNANSMLWHKCIQTVPA